MRQHEMRLPRCSQHLFLTQLGARLIFSRRYARDDEIDDDGLLNMPAFGRPAKCMQEDYLAA